VFGRDAFRTATGVHAAAIIKALRNHDRKLADSVYSGVPAHLVGLEQIVEIGPMSGKSNVVYWLARHGIAETDELVNRIFEAAKQSPRVLTDDEIRAICAASGAAA
jgi:2-isopropylmalate synthase